MNLTLNVGFGPGATHTVLDADPRGALKNGQFAAMRDIVGSGSFKPDNRYDRWSLLFELMARYRDAAMARRLARSVYFRQRIDPSTRFHLAPFLYPAEALAVLEHLRAAGVATPTTEMIEVELRKEIAAVPGRQS